MGCCTSTPPEHVKLNTQPPPTENKPFIGENKKSVSGQEQCDHKIKANSSDDDDNQKQIKNSSPTPPAPPINIEEGNNNDPIADEEKNDNINIDNKETLDEIMGDTVDNVEIVAEKQKNIINELEKLNFLLDKIEDRISNVIDTDLVDGAHDINIDSDEDIQPLIEKESDDSEDETANFNQLSSLHNTETVGRLMVIDDDDSDSDSDSD